jgi:hypothetical protein
MSLSQIAPIVEGHGEVASVRMLLHRVFAEIIGAPVIPEVLQPIRVSKSKVVRDDAALLRAVDLAALKLASKGEAGLILLMLDADDDLACSLAPELLATIRRARSHLDVACVIAVVEFETWFVASAESLERYWHPEYRDAIPKDPEVANAGKGWVEKFYIEKKYSETIDQVRLTAAFDPAVARNRSRSFDKLCRELERRSPDRS